RESDEVCPEEEDVRVDQPEHQVIADVIGLSEGGSTFDTWVATDSTAPPDPSTHKLVSTGGVLVSSSSDHLLSHGVDVTVHYNAVALFLPSPSLPHDIVAHFGSPSHVRSKAIGHRLDLSVVFDERVVDRESVWAGLREVGCSERWQRTSAPAKRKKAAQGLHIVEPSLAKETVQAGNDPFLTPPHCPCSSFNPVCLTDPPFHAGHFPSASSTTGTPSPTKIYWGQLNEMAWKVLKHAPDTIVSSVKQHEAREGGGEIWVETQVAVLELWECGQEAVEVMTRGALWKEQVGKVVSKPSPSFDPGLIHWTARAQLADIVGQLFLTRPLMHGKKATVVLCLTTSSGKRQLRMWQVDVPHPEAFFYHMSKAAIFPIVCFGGSCTAEPVSGRTPTVGAARSQSKMDAAMTTRRRAPTQTAISRPMHTATARSTIKSKGKGVDRGLPSLHSAPPKRSKGKGVN
ncbi:hypothetical protein JCM1840_002060, partial [Sporobolomyces johnsonii]